MKTITAVDFMCEIKKDNALIIDVRSPDEFAYGHIPHSINIPLDELKNRLNEIPRDQKIYLVCQSGMRSVTACASLENMGLTGALTIEGGINAIQKAGGELEKSTNIIPLMRQVQIAAGSLVVLGILLSTWIHPAFLLLSTFVGAGLIFAGVTGFCGMARVLEKMPWNKKI